MTPARKPTPVRKPARSSSGRFYAALAIVGIAGIAAIAWLASKPRQESRAVNTGAVPTKAEPWVLGNANAPVTIAEFADFECPACGSFANITEPDVRTRLIETGKARFEFYPFPLEMHKNTWDASLAAACAGDAGKFWEMHDRLFQGQFEWYAQATSNPRKVIRKYAQDLALDMSAYDQCMESEKHRPRIQASLNHAVSLGVGQTPTFLIGGRLYPGDIPFDVLKRAVDEAAASAPATSAPAAGTGSATATSTATATSPTR